MHDSVVRSADLAVSRLDWSRSVFPASRMVLLPSQSEPGDSASFAKQERRASVEIQEPSLVAESQEPGFTPRRASVSRESSTGPSRGPTRLMTAPAATLPSPHVQLAQRLYDDGKARTLLFSQGRDSVTAALSSQVEDRRSASLQRSRSAMELQRLGTPKHLNISGSPSFRHLHQDSFRGSPGFCGRHGDLLPLPKSMTPDPETGVSRMHSCRSHSAAALSSASSAFLPKTGTMRMRHVRQQSLASLHAVPTGGSVGGGGSRGSGSLIASPSALSLPSPGAKERPRLSYGKDHEALLRALASLRPPHAEGPKFEGQEIVGARVPLYSTLRRAPTIKRQATNEGVIWRQDIKIGLTRGHELPTNDVVDRALLRQRWLEQQGSKGPREYTKARDDPVPRCISRGGAVQDPEPGLKESRRLYAAALA